MFVKEAIKSELLLEKGIDLLWSKGYNGTSVNDIVKAADVPKGSFYFYFDSKEDFVIKALQKYFVKVFSPANKILQDTTLSPKERLVQFYTHRCETLKKELQLEKGCMACNLGNEIGEHNENVRKAVLDIHNKVIECIVKVAEEAKEAGELSTPMQARDLVEFIEDAGKGAMVSMKEMKSAYPVDNFLRIVNGLLLK